MPGAPLNVTATAGLAGTTVTWTAPANGGSPITQYTVTPKTGTTSLPPTTVTGAPAGTSVVVHGLTAGTSYTFTVTALNNAGPGPSSAPSNAITALNECPCTMFGNAIPAVGDAGPDQSVELGMKFIPDTNGSITSVRFFKSGANTGVHTGTLWTAAGVQLATVTFSGETNSGWQQAAFSAPVNVTAGVTYVVSYHSTTGHYASDSHYFLNQVDAAPLHAPSSAASEGNGLYRYGPSAIRICPSTKRTTTSTSCSRPGSPATLVLQVHGSARRREPQGEHGNHEPATPRGQADGGTACRGRQASEHAGHTCDPDRPVSPRA